jgi:outer membrane receptor protein involved in Fe transport
MKNVAKLLVLALLALGFVVISAFGQTITGSIVGSVLDPTGAVIVGASVVATNVDTGVTYSTTTGSEGFYTLAQMPPGKYDVTVQSKGFKTSVSPGNLVDVQKTTRVDFTLATGSLSEKVEVSSQVPLIESTTSDIGSIISEKEVNNLPINGRLYQMMVFLVPGTTPQAWGDQDENPAASGSPASGGPGNGTYASVNGFFFAGNLFLVDGVHNNEPANDYITMNIPFADIQEMNIETSNPTAEYGTFGGAVINLTTKSGTNEFHGQAFDYIRNESLNAFSAFALVKAPYNANQVGGAIGGPIKKDKLFFFTDFQYLDQSAGQTYNLAVPTAQMRTGNLSGLVKNGAGPINNAAACQVLAAANGLANAVPCQADGAVSVPGTYDIVPAADINPISTAVLNPDIIPLPNNSSTNKNAIFNTVNTETVPQFDARVDYAISSKDRIFGRESYLHRDYNSPAPGTLYMQGSNPNATNANHLAVVAWDHIFSPTMTNQFRFGFNRYVTDDFVDSFAQKNINNELGILNGNLPGVPATYGIAEFNFQNSNLSPTGDPGPIPNGQGRLANIFEYADGLSKVIGRQTLKFGLDIQHIQGAVSNPQNNPRGCFNFNGEYTGNSFADFLVGAPGGGGCPGGGAMERDLFIDLPAVRWNFIGFYAQDDFRLTQNFTLNLGLRYDIYTTPVSVNNTQSNFVDSGPDAGLIQLATSNNRAPNVNTFYGGVQPRIGFAYSPDDGKTAIRGAFGISYFPDNFGADSGTLERNYPELIQENFLAFPEPAGGCTLASTPQFTSCGSLILANGLPGTTPSANSSFYPLLVTPSSAGGVPCLTGFGTTVTTPAGFVCPPAGSAVFEIEKNFKPDSVYSWNLSAQRSLGHDMSFQAAYVGNKGYNLFHNYQLNQCYPPENGLLPGSGTPFSNYPGCLPFPAVIPSGPAAGGLVLSAVNARNSSGASRYNALELEFQKRTSFGLTVLASYTFSKLLDNVTNPISAYDTSLQLVGEGWKNGNYPNSFVISYIYDLPFGNGHRYMSDASGITNRLVSGWQVSGITTFRSGGALLITGNNALLPPGADMEVANFNCRGQSFSNPHNASEWFNTSCFSEPALGTIGSGRTGNVYGPGFQNWDFNIAKSIPLWSETKQFRIEANFFNIFNHLNFGNPDTNLPDGASFGTITSQTGLSRQIQFGVKFLF